METPRIKTTPLPPREAFPAKEALPPPPIPKVYPQIRPSPKMRPQRPIFSSLWLQGTACLAVVLMVLSLSVMDFAPAQKLVQGLRYALSTGEQAVWAENTPVFTAAPMACDPTRQGYALQYQSTGAVRAPAAGTVYDCTTNESGQSLLRLRHDGGYESRFVGLEILVQPGDELQGGDALGRLAEGKTLTYTLYRYGKPVTLS